MAAARSSPGGGAARAGGRTPARGTPTGEPRTWAGSGRPVRCSSTSSCRPGTTSPLSWSRARLASRGGVDEGDPATVGRVGAGRLGHGHGDGGGARAPGAHDGDQPTEGRPTPGRHGRCRWRSKHVTVGPFDGAGVLAEHGEDRVAVDRLGEHGDGTEVGPAPTPGAAGDHDRSASGPAGLVEQIVVEGRCRPSSMTAADQDRPTARRALTSSAETQRTNPPGSAAEVAQRPTSANHGPRPSRPRRQLLEHRRDSAPLSSMIRHGPLD